jgi:Lipocalin-like domain
MPKQHKEREQMPIGQLKMSCRSSRERLRGTRMNRRAKRNALLGIIFAATALGATEAAAQTAREIEGTWKLATARVTSEAKTRDIFGPHPAGIMVFGAGGRFVQVIIAADLPKFASKGRETGTAEENKAVVQGSIAYFGTYSVGSGGIVDLHVESSTFPNMTGSDQKRSIKLSGDEMIWGNATPAVGSGVAEQVWRRAK